MPVKTKIEPKVEPKKFDPADLSKEQLEACVEEYLGIHPRYFLYEGLQVKLNFGLFNYEKNVFNGWKPARWRYTGEKPPEGSHDPPGYGKSA